MRVCTRLNPARRVFQISSFQLWGYWRCRGRQRTRRRPDGTDSRTHPEKTGGRRGGAQKRPEFRAKIRKQPTMQPDTRNAAREPQKRQSRGTAKQPPQQPTTAERIQRGTGGAAASRCPQQLAAGQAAPTAPTRCRGQRRQARPTEARHGCKGMAAD